MKTARQARSRRRQTVAEMISSLRFDAPDIVFDPHPVTGGSTVARILSILYRGGPADRAELRKEAGSDVRRRLHDMLGHNLVEPDGDRLAITDNGMWHHIAAELGLSMPELCVVAAIYSQMSQIVADPEMMAYAPHCWQNYAFLDRFSMSNSRERDVWSSLYRKGYIRKIDTLRVVMDGDVISLLDAYRPCLVRLYFTTVRPMAPARLATS